MKACLFLSLIAVLFGIAWAFYWSAGTLNAEKRIQQGLDKAESGLSSSNWQLTRAGVDEIHWADKDLYVSRAIWALGLIVALVASLLSIVFASFVCRMKPAISAISEPCPKS